MAAINDLRQEFRQIFLCWRKSSGLGSLGDTAARLGVAKWQVIRWNNGEGLPARKFWPVLVSNGVCSKQDLKDLAARRSALRPRKYSLRGMRIYPLSEYAARAS